MDRHAADAVAMTVAAIGGTTRILIIDDDPRPAQPHVDRGESGAGMVDGLLVNGAAQSNDPSFPAGDGQLVHEYQVATPPPLSSEPADPGTLEVENTVCADVSVVRDLITRVEELLHRTRRLPAGGSAGWNGTIRFGTVLVEPATQTVLRGGQPVRVTHTEFRLLLALMRRRGAIASRMELLREVWGAGAVVSRRAIDTHIARLRRKLEDDPANPRHILTALAWGYRFRP